MPTHKFHAVHPAIFVVSPQANAGRAGYVGLHINHGENNNDNRIHSGALVALAVAIVLILRKVPPAYGMIAGALAGGLCGGADLVQTVTLMIGGAQGITNAVMRILAAGCWPGC